MLPTLRVPNYPRNATIIEGGSLSPVPATTEVVRYGREHREDSSCLMDAYVRAVTDVSDNTTGLIIDAYRRLYLCSDP